MTLCTNNHRCYDTLKPIIGYIQNSMYYTNSATLFGEHCTNNFLEGVFLGGGGGGWWFRVILCVCIFPFFFYFLKKVRK